MDMTVYFRRYSGKGGGWHPTPFLVTVAERVVREIGFPVEFEKFEEMKKRIMEILKEEYMKADSKSLDVSEVCLSNKEFIEDEWRVKIEFYGMYISHDWLKNRKRLEDCYLKDVIEIYPTNQDVAALSEQLEKLESELTDKKVEYFVQLISFCDSDDENCIRKFLRENKYICDYDKVKNYKRENDYAFYTHEFVTGSLPSILSFIRTKILPHIRTLQAPQIRDGEIIDLLNKPENVLLISSVDDKRVHIETLLESFKYFYAEKI